MENLHKIVVFKMFIDDITISQQSVRDKFNEWALSDLGKYVFEHSKNVDIKSDFSYSTYKYQKHFIAVAEFTEKNLINYYLKWGNIKND